MDLTFFKKFYSVVKISIYTLFLISCFLSFSQVGSDTLSIKEEFPIVEESANFPGGLSEWAEYLRKNQKYPKEARKKRIEGRVFAEFIVEKDGRISNVKIVKGIGNGCDEETIRLLQMSPPWNPGKCNDEPCRQKFIQNIMFRLPR